MIHPVLVASIFVIAIAESRSFAEMDAPEIARPGLKWFNVAAPLPIASLRGRIVILDFWTEGCINCIQIIPTLRRIEERFPDEVVVIGVHSPKFANEKNPASVKDAIHRYEIQTGDGPRRSRGGAHEGTRLPVGSGEEG
jgi:thiol-disulfide isomerase/thioredoxin